jgi:hypothetical protein
MPNLYNNYIILIMYIGNPVYFQKRSFKIYHILVANIGYTATYFLQFVWCLGYGIGDQGIMVWFPAGIKMFHSCTMTGLFVGPT